MKKQLPTVLLIIGLLFVSAKVQAIPISINNNSFENPTIDGGGAMAVVYGF